jgi:hypothetical protein
LLLLRLAEENDDDEDVDALDTVSLLLTVCVVCRVEMKIDSKLSAASPKQPIVSDMLSIW